MNLEHIETDILVVGGGGAGFRAAIAACEKGARTVLLSKGPLARCGASPMAGADFTLDGNSMNKLGREGDPNDSMEKVFNDIISQGYFLNNQKLVEQYVKTAPRLLSDLITYGLEILMSDQRMIYTHGTHIMDVLLKKAREAGVKLVEDIMLLDLLTKDGKVTGGIGLDIRSGKFIKYSAGAVIMATGGWHKAFWPNTGMRDLSGEGIAMASRAGATIGNMEFVTFCCNVMYEPPMWLGSLAPYLTSLICGGKLTNNKGEDILVKYDPELVKIGTSTEWNKSFVSYACCKEMRDGNAGPNGGVYYSRGPVPWDMFKMVCEFMFPNWKYKALDLATWGAMLEQDTPIEVGPAVEFFDGGIVINERMETSLEGLYAAGECTLGAFGSNRVFSAITEMLVHGLDAGENAAAYALKHKAIPLDEREAANLAEAYQKPLSQKDGLRPAEVRREVQIRAHRHLGPIRNETELKELLEFLQVVKNYKLPNLCTTGKGHVYNKEWLDAIELKNILFLLEASTRSALARTESRGVHIREDHLYTDNDNWLKESQVNYRNGLIEISHRPVTVTSMKPPTGRLPYLEMMKKMMQMHSDTGGKH
jgi:succinate dehydrogenase/fumarate reductase flavoprotein subunit